MTARHPDARPAAFLDRDGVVNIDRGYVSRHEDFTFVPGLLEGARSLHRLGFALVVVTNQSGIGRGMYDEATFEQLTSWMKKQFADASAPLSGVYYCPHHPTEAHGRYRRDCDCRKPAAGMLFAAARDLELDLGRSVMFGDRASDLMAAAAAGVPNRVLLWTDACKEPEAMPAGLATSSFRRLDEAASDSALIGAITSGATVRP
jgi:D-glycero-D-manno-heptose 1,7-bisphosphate phosphatase